jgi:predicted ribonuclease YlaK
MHDKYRAHSMHWLLIQVKSEIDNGIPLSKLGNKDASGRLFFQTRLNDWQLPQGLPVGKADNQILAVVRGCKNNFLNAPLSWYLKISTCASKRVR